MPDSGQDDPLSAAVRGGGQVQSEVPQSDLLEQAISSRQNFEQRRKELIGRLPYANKKQERAITAELHGIDLSERASYQEAMAGQRERDMSQRMLLQAAIGEQHQRDFEANQRRMVAHTGALEADRQWKVDRETEIDEHGAAMIQGLGQLRGQLRNGRITEDQYHEGLLDLGQKYPYGFRHPEAAKRYEFDIGEADKMRDFAQRRDIAESVKLAAKYGVQAHINETTGLPDLEGTRAAVAQTPKFRQEAIHGMNIEMMQKYGVGTGVSSLFNPVAPHTSPDEGKSIDIPFRDPKTGNVAKTTIPMPLFNQMKSDFQDRYFALVPQQSQTTNPRTELAQRALTDPNATEAHKAAARSILGIQDNAQ